MAVKKLISMTQEQVRLLKQLAEAEVATEDEVMRRALESCVARRLRDPFDDLIGMCDGGPEDGAENHDLYLYGDRAHAEKPAD